MQKVTQFQPKKLTAKQILKQFSSCSFQAYQLGRAYEICRKMIFDKKCDVILTLSGALVPGGMRNCITQCIKNNWVQAIISTGANVTHDLMSAFGEEYIHSVDKDEKLRKKGLSRIYDIVSPDESSIKFEKEIQKLLPRGEYTPSELLENIGKKIRDRNSFVAAASKKRIPIFCPGISDSILGFQIWMHQQETSLRINEIRDLEKIFDYMYELRKKRKKTGVIILGGGVPKNFALQASIIPGKPYDYAVQITTDVPHFGGLSGADLEEGISWGKIKPAADIATVNCDVTIAFPLIVSALKEK